MTLTDINRLKIGDKFTTKQDTILTICYLDNNCLSYTVTHRNDDKITGPQPHQTYDQFFRNANKYGWTPLNTFNLFEEDLFII